MSGIFAALAEFKRELIASVHVQGTLQPVGVKTGCPRKMDRSAVMMAMTKRTVNAAEVARRLGITTTTLYAYVNGDRSVKQAGQLLLKDE